MESKSKNNIILIALLAVVVGSVVVYKSLAKNLEAGNEIAVAQTAVKNNNQAVVSSEYKNGTYTSTGSYVSPGGPETVEITLTIENDIITDVQFVGKAELPASQFFQEKFDSAYKELVLGKNINEVALDKVAGSSLTPHGFNDAIAKIKTQAKS